MTTRADLRTRIRAELNDLGATRLWPDERLNAWLVESLRWLGRELGLEKATGLTSVANQAGYALPADVVEVTRVEHPIGAFRLPIAHAGGDVAPDAALDVSSGLAAAVSGTYDVYGGQLILSPAPDRAGETIAVRYRGAYAEPPADAGVLDVPLRDEDAVLFSACARACAWLAMDEGKRQRFERQRGASPAAVAQEYDREARAVVRQRRARVASRRLVIRNE
jgi:hypothetical protein